MTMDTTEALKSVDEALRSNGLLTMTLREGLIARAILAAVELAREEIRAAAQLVASKPVAGEWTQESPFNDKAWRRLIDGRTMLIVDNWHPNIGCAWRVFQRGGKLTMGGAEFASNSGDAYQNARDAADAWARDNAHLLDWTLPPAPVQPVAPAVPQPAPGATVDEVVAAVVVDGYVMDGRINRIVNTVKLRASLSTLSPAQLATMLSAIGAAK